MKLSVRNAGAGGSGLSRVCVGGEQELHVYVEWRKDAGEPGEPYVVDWAPREGLDVDIPIGVPWRGGVPALSKSGWRLWRFQMGTGQPQPHWQEYTLRRGPTEES